MQAHYEDLWRLVLDELAKLLSKSLVELWFSRMTLYSVSDKDVVLICDEAFKYKVITNKYLDTLCEAFEKVLGFAVEVIIVNREADPAEYDKYVHEEIEFPDERSSTNVGDISGDTPALPDKAEEETEESADSGEGEQVKREVPRPETPLQNQTYLSEYTFDNFIVGNSNKFAHAASVAVANDPACNANVESYTYNPLFIYGPSGLGKTHLLYAIINHINKSRPNIRIVYVKGEEFTNQLIDAISKKTTEQFRQKYRTVDILLIDDIQFIAGRDSTQEEFFHTFNALYEDHKQIILTSDRPPRDIKTLEDRLKTRFEWGITADIQPPDADLRAAILKKKAAAMDIKLSNDVVNFLAENLKSNIRQMEGAIKKLGALSMLTGTPITIELAKNSIADLMTGGEPVGVTIDRILEKVAKKYGVSTEDIRGSKRTKEIAWARHISIYLIRKLTDMSLPQIGKIFNRDHTTVINSLKTIEKELGSNSITDIDIADLTKEIKG